jgi:broad specificity phosphatase PhoE
MMTEIVIVRHGETESNKRGIFRGRLDVPLNERGILQAEWVADALQREPVAAVLSSPLSRAVDTARIIAARHGLAPIVDRAFDNIDLGQWQGREKAAVKREEPGRWKTWVSDPDSLSIPGGESLASVRARALARTLELAREHRGRRFVVVTHRSVAKLLVGALLGMETGYFWKFYLDNAGYSVIGHDENGFVLLRWNEACHVQEKVIEEY